MQPSTTSRQCAKRKQRATSAHVRYSRYAGATRTKAHTLTRTLLLILGKGQKKALFISWESLGCVIVRRDWTVRRSATAPHQSEKRLLPPTFEFRPRKTFDAHFEVVSKQRNERPRCVYVDSLCVISFDKTVTVFSFFVKNARLIGLKGNDKRSFLIETISFLFEASSKGKRLLSNGLVLNLYDPQQVA